jgi:hypothetical protein
MTAAAFADEAAVPVPQGGTTTVRAASAVGTTTARVPRLIVLLLLPPLPMAPAITSTATKPAMMIQIAGV